MPMGHLSRGPASSPGTGLEVQGTVIAYRPRILEPPNGGRNSGRPSTKEPRLQSIKVLHPSLGTIEEPYETSGHLRPGSGHPCMERGLEVCRGKGYVDRRPIAAVNDGKEILSLAA